MRKAARPLLSMRRAFELHGVMLKYPTRSASGVRFDDGAVMFAIPSEQVRADRRGCKVLLCSPGMRPPLAADEASAREWLHHCRLAMRHGVAEGMLVHPDGSGIDATRVLRLRMIELDGEYWASWDSRRTFIIASGSQRRRPQWHENEGTKNFAA
jgi:hypothetical protein